MTGFLRSKLVVAFLLVLQACAKQTPVKCGKKNVVLCQPKHHQAAVVLYGNGGGGQSEGDRETLNALANNVETVTNLVKAQSEVIENLSHQVSTIAEGIGNKEKFKQMFEKLAKDSRFIQNVTERLNSTVKKVKKLAVAWSESTVNMTKQLKGLKKESDENEQDMEGIERSLMQKIEKLQEEMKTLRVSINYAHSECAACKEAWPNGSYCILANGSCPEGFKRHHGHLKSLYLYSAHPQFANDAKFGSSSIGCLGGYCEHYGNFIGALTLVTCCK
ncbi:structural maintenance of chromosomes protein 4-like [Montipora foliosa]|uniref:structural maintenance of chromosomes protein 4-like n=1 Tax=Montipora foliosa TaxID=591990 RepID=UPI0035F1534E